MLKVGDKVRYLYMNPRVDDPVYTVTKVTRRGEVIWIDNYPFNFLSINFYKVFVEEYLLAEDSHEHKKVK